MGKKMSLSVDMKELNNIAILNNTTAAGFGDSLGRDNLPIVISVIVGITGNLLAWQFLSLFLTYMCRIHSTYLGY